MSGDTNMRLNLPQPLRISVSKKFNQARASKSLIFSDTHLSVIHSKAGIPFQLRYCPALSKKPVDSKLQFEKRDPAEKKRFDPFENPSPDLLVTRIPDQDNYTHNLVLNKYPVIPNHFILATRENKPQTNLLEEDDLALTYACLRAWASDSGLDEGNQRHELYAFFNSGDQSGASQPHRHLQFLPVPDMRGSVPTSEWGLLCDRMTTLVYSSKECELLHDLGLPIVHLATRISVSVTARELHERYLLLLRAASMLVGSGSATSTYTSGAISQLLSSSNLSSTTIATETGRALLSYNLSLTSKIMAIFPRRAEDAVLTELATDVDSGVGNISINGTILAGTLMVKNEDEWDVLKGKPELMDGLLKQVGFPRGEGNAARM